MKKLMMAVVACACALGLSVGNDASAGSLPSAYQAVEYIESTGQQYIDKFYPCDAKTRIEIDFTLVSGASATTVFGAGYTGNQWLFISRSNEGFLIYGKSGQSLGAAVHGSRYFGVFEQDWATLTNLTAGTSKTVASGAAMGPASGSLSIRLFRDTANTYWSHIKLHSIKVYEDGALVRDCVPCYTVDGRVPGLYDTANDHFYTNDNASATEDFNLGAETENSITVRGEPDEPGEPVCGSLVGYGNRLVTGGEQVVAQVDETEASTYSADWSLLGWRLDVSDANGTVTTTSTAENFNRCAFTHEDGKKDVVTWLWRKTPKLPDDYVPVEYIESTGAQYIKGVYTCTPNTRVDLDLRLVSTSGSTALFAGSWGQGWLLQLNGRFVSYGNGETILNEAIAGDLYHAQIEYTTATVSNTVKGTSGTKAGIKMGSGNAHTIAIFATNGGGNKSTYALYGMQIYEKDDGGGLTLERDLVPCYTTIDDQKVAGVWDLVGEKFYANAGTGADFKTGPATADYLTIAGAPGEYGTPSGEVSGYDTCKLADGQVATVTMDETVVEQDTLTATLRGWVLTQKAANGVITETRSTDANLATCTFTHQGGDHDTLTWLWDVAYKRAVPEGYQQVEYIQTTGSQSISSVYTCGQDTKIEMDFRLDATSPAGGVFGGGWGNYWLLQINGSFTMWAGGTWIGDGVAGSTYHSVHTATWSVMTNLTRGVASRGEYGRIADATISLFNVSGNKAKLALYGMSISEKGEYAEELKRLFVPCYTNDNGTKVAGLYDVVNAKFYTNAGTGADFVLGADADNFVEIVGDPGEASEPVCGSFVGYGRRTSLTDGEEVTCTMPETTIESPELGASLLGWKLEIFKGETLVSTTTNTVENVDTCTFTHQRGNFARLTWRWKSKYRVTVEASGGLDVSPAYKWVDGGEDVTFTATGGGAVWAGAGLDPRTHRSQTCKITNVTGPVTLTVSPPNVVYVSTNGVDEAGRGTADAPYKTIKYAIANTAAPLDVMVGAGLHLMAKADLPTLADDIRVIGEGRDKTTLRYEGNAPSASFMTLNHVYAVVCGLTVKTSTNATWMNQSGGDVFEIASGTVSNVLLTACGTSGGTGIVNLRGDDAYFCDSVISNCMNWASAYCMLSASAGLVERVRVTRNYTGYADSNGCGIRLTGKTAVIRNCLIDKANLTALISKNCPAAYVSKGLLENCTIVDNYVKGSPNTGLFVASADAEIRNCIIHGNKGADLDTVNIAVADEDCRAAITYSCCPDLPVGVNNNLSVDPNFTDAANGDYTLQKTSLCINMGGDTEAELDFAGNPRKYNGSLPDMGCYEFQGEPVVEMSVVFAPTESHGMEELDTTFIAVLAGAGGAPVDYAWDFGDGSSVAHTSVPTVDHHYGAPGEYTVILTCDNGIGTCGYTNTCIYVNSTAPVRYVNVNSPNPKYPYTTAETACRDFDTVWTMTPAPTEIHVAPGTYYVTPSKRVYTLDRAVKLIGDNPDTVKFFCNESQSGKAIFTLDHKDALLAGVRLEVTNNSYSDGVPAGLDIVSGVASNVLISGCGSHTVGAVRLRGPDALFVDSRMTHCKSWDSSVAVLYITEGVADRITLTNNVEHYSNAYETALRLNGANAICRNSFIARNSGGGTRGLMPAVRVTKGVLENCTVVGNNGGTATCGGVYVAADADAVVRNCISIDNKATGSETTKNVQLADGASVSHCCSPDLEDGVNGNKSGDPQFKTVRGTGFAYGIRSTSPCFNAGERLPWMDGALDYLHQPRVNAAPDIGCVESQSKGLLLMVK